MSRAPRSGSSPRVRGRRTSRRELAAAAVETALGALLGHITGGADADTFQPMNVNFGLMPPLPERFRKADRKQAYTDRARVALAEWLLRFPPHETSWGGEPAELVEVISAGRRR